MCGVSGFPWGQGLSHEFWITVWWLCMYNEESSMQVDLYSLSNAWLSVLNSLGVDDRKYTTPDFLSEPLLVMKWASDSVEAHAIWRFICVPACVMNGWCPQSLPPTPTRRGALRSWCLFQANRRGQCHDNSYLLEKLGPLRVTNFVLCLKCKCFHWCVSCNLTEWPFLWNWSIFWTPPPLL